MSTMNVLLVEPPERPPPVASYEQIPSEGNLFAPPWSLLCLRAYILKHSRHHCDFLDLRLSTDLEGELVRTLTDLPSPRVVVVRTSSLDLGPSSAVVEIAKRRVPDTITVIVGQHPSQFPDIAGAMPRVDFALAGDPEPILRNLLDYYDLPPRLERIPGLIVPGRTGVEPCWLNELNSLTPPDWTGVFWPGYVTTVPHAHCRAELRLSRGSPKTPAARYDGQAYEPFRHWPVKRLASLMEKCSHLGVTEVAINDPPSYWVEARLNQWLAELSRAHNTMHWSLRMYPAILSDEHIDQLAYTLCRRIHFHFPTCSLHELRELWCPVQLADLRDSFQRLRDAGITPHATFWIGNPETERNEEEDILATLRDLDYCEYSLQAFPFGLDTPLYQQRAESNTTPQLSEWIAWARDPWTREQPVALWGGREQQRAVQRSMAIINRTVQHSPKRILRWVKARLNLGQWIHAIEHKTSGAINPR